MGQRPGRHLRSARPPSREGPVLPRGIDRVPHRRGRRRRSSPGIGSIFRRAHRTRRRWARRAAAAWRRGDREGRVPRRSALVLRARAASAPTCGRSFRHSRTGPMWSSSASRPDGEVSRRRRGSSRRPGRPRSTFASRSGPVSGLVRGPQATSASCVRIDRSDPCDEPRGDRAGAARAGARRDGARPRVRAVPRAIPTKVAEALPARTLDRAGRSRPGARPLSVHRHGARGGRGRA